MKEHKLHAVKTSSIPALSFWLQASKQARQRRSHSLGREADTDHSEEQLLLIFPSERNFLLWPIKRILCGINNVVNNFLAALMFLTAADLKKCTVWELRIKFYLGENENYSSGDSISGSSEKLLQRRNGGGQYICDFGEGGVYAIKHIFFCRRFLLVSWRLLLVPRSRRHHEGIECFSRYEEMQELGS